MKHLRCRGFSSHTVGFVGRFKASRHVPLTLGRSRTNRVVLTDLAVSKEHAQVLFSEGAGFVVADDGRYVGGGSSVAVPGVRGVLCSTTTACCASNNGTFVNEVRLSKPKEPSGWVAVHEGTTIQIGSTVMVATYSKPKGGVKRQRTGTSKTEDEGDAQVPPVRYRDRAAERRTR